MNDINSLGIIGRLTADAQIKTFDNGFSIISFDICFNTAVKNKEGKYEDYPNFVSVKYPGKNIDNFLTYLIKGKQVGIEGHLKQDRWETDGKKNSKVLIEAEHIQLCGGASRKEESSAPSEGFQEDFPY